MNCPSLSTALRHLGLTLYEIPGINMLPIAGRVRFCTSNWAQITSDQWVLQTVQGYRLDLLCTPVQRRVPNSLKTSTQECESIDEEVTKLMQKAAVRQVEATEGQFLSRVFLVPKKDGSQRPVVNLKPLNCFIKPQHFKMEGTRMVKDLLTQGDWMVSVDLKDAYLSVPVAEEHRKFLRFEWNQRIYEFQCLPFGLSSAPRVFTKTLKPVMAVLRQRGIRSVIFIDDTLLMSQSNQELAHQAHEMVRMLHLLGFLVNREKSILTPTRQIQFLGFIINSELMTFSLPEAKVRSIIKDCRATAAQEKTSVRNLARLLGKMSACSQAVLPAPLYYRNIQRLKIQSLAATDSFETEVTLTAEAKQELQWWIQEIRHWNGKAVSQPTPDMVIETDASMLGWGAAHRDLTTGGLWSQEERSHHINHLELMGGAFALRTFAKSKRDVHVRLRMDNTSAIAYINHMGGTRSQSLARSACQLWHWCLQRGITVSAEHLPGVQNVAADVESRTMRTSAEWKLHPEVFQAIMQLMGPCRVDLFATRLNTQLNHYISWQPDPFAMETDAFQITWCNMEGYAFPPFAMIGRCLQKIRREQSSVVLVAPMWPAQPWYALLLQLLVDLPVLIPSRQGLLKDPFNREHPLVTQNQLALAAWKVSGSVTDQRAFQRGLPDSSGQDGVEEPIPRISQHGKGGVVGVLNGKRIPFRVGFQRSSTS